MLAHNPRRVIHDAVRGMLPKNTLAIHMLTRLKLVVGGSTQRYQSQITGSAKAVEKAAKQAAEGALQQAPSTSSGQGQGERAEAATAATAVVAAEPAKAAVKSRPSTGSGRAGKGGRTEAPEIKLAKTRGAKAAEMKATERKPKAEHKAAATRSKKSETPDKSAKES